MRFHKIANVNKALDYIASKGVKLVSIGAEGELRQEWPDAMLAGLTVAVDPRVSRWVRLLLALSTDR